MGEVNLHEILTTTKFSNVHETTSHQRVCCVQEIALCMWISCNVGMTVQFSKEMITFC